MRHHLLVHIEVRRAEPGDLPVLSHVYCRSSLSNEGDRPLLAEHPEFLELDDAGVREGRTWVAIVDGRIVGFSTTIDHSDRFEVEDLFVDPEWMRRGVGRVLVDELRNRARAAGRSRVEVDANRHALAFYRSVGFVDLASVDVQHGTAIRMRLTV